MKASNPAVEVDGFNAFLINTFGYVTIGILLSCFVGFIVSSVPALTALALNPITLIILLIAYFVCAITTTPYNSAKAAWFKFLTVAVIFGVFGFIGVMTYGAYVSTMAFAATAVTSSTAILYGYTTKKDLTKWSSFLAIGFIALIVMIIANWFIGSPAMHFLISLIIIPLYLMFIAYMIKHLKVSYYEKAANSEKSLAVYGALYIFIALYVLYSNFQSIFGD